MEARDFIYSTRVTSGLTQQEFAYKCGVGKSTVNMWESGKRIPSDRVLYKVATVFDRVDDLKRFGLIKEISNDESKPKKDLAKELKLNAIYSYSKNLNTLTGKPDEMRTCLDQMSNLVDLYENNYYTNNLSEKENILLSAYRNSPSNIQNAVVALLGITNDLEEDIEKDEDR